MTVPDAPAGGVIRLTIPGYGPFRPTVHVNDRLVPARFGTQDVPVPAGRTVVRAYVTAMAEHGHAELAVDVAPGAVETVHYSPPWMYGLPGVMSSTTPTGWRRIAPSPQAAIIVAVVAVFVLYGLLR
ncbi:hypothetical protein [Oryzobacter terrae]|uniref:hypothetical protein n=1 Tax=Oryzobacter terrae TaxID=1620385 RepID=UPI0036726CEA